MTVGRLTRGHIAGLVVQKTVADFKTDSRKMVMQALNATQAIQYFLDVLFPSYLSQLSRDSLTAVTFCWSEIHLLLIRWTLKCVESDRRTTTMVSAD
jgi:hypothetical protein